MEKEIIWTDQAKADLRNIYIFNTFILDKRKAFNLIENIIKKTDQLSRRISGGTRYISDIDPSISYEKLIYRHYVVIYRIEGNYVYINKAFDARQNPEKLKL